MQLAFLFPGQGSQRVGMGAELAANFAAARRVYDEADQALGFSLSRLCFKGPEEELRFTENTQPAVLATSIAALRALKSEFEIRPRLAAGHSLGEYSALVAAGALDFADALRAVRERGRLMQAAVPAGRGAMAALIGLKPAVVQEICAAVSSGADIALPANLNAPGQIVVAGHAGAVRRAIEMAKQRGARMSIELNVSAPFHCPLMQPARDAMAAVLEALEVRPLDFGVIANVTAQVNRERAQVVPLLLEQITAPVRWEESMATVAAERVDAALEIGPGRVLAGLMRRISKGLKVMAVEDATTLRAVGEALSGAGA